MRVVARSATVRDEVPVLTEWPESPEYVAFITTEPAANGGVYVTKQPPDELDSVERLQVAPAKLPPAPPSLQLTEPVGVVGDPLMSVTVALSTIESPITVDEGFGSTPVLVGAIDSAVVVKDD